MVRQFEVMIGYQQDPTVLLNACIAGFGSWYTGRQPGITNPVGQIARQSHDAATVVAKPLNRTALWVK
ncbi:hypothetical protein D3C75_1198790 [compost metagenome]